MTASPSHSIRLPQGFWAMKAGTEILVSRKSLCKGVSRG
jgi:hypothetical protein